jgi:hypothetical protein
MLKSHAYSFQITFDIYSFSPLLGQMLKAELSLLFLGNLLSHATALFCFERVLLYARPTWTMILLFVLPWVAGMTGVCHHTQPLVSWTVCPGWLQIASPWSVPPGELGLQAWVHCTFFFGFFFRGTRVWTLGLLGSCSTTRATLAALWYL